MRCIIWVLMALLLSACASPAVHRGDRPLPHGIVGAFSLEARFSVTGDGERHSGRLSWRHSGGGDELRILSPFGQVVAEIDVRPGLARLITADRRVFEAPDAHRLTRDVLGYALPIGRLSAWVLARPGPHAGVEADAAGRPVLVDEEGWRVEYEYADDALALLPIRLTATRVGGPELRLRIEEWFFE